MLTEPWTNEWHCRSRLCDRGTDIEVRLLLLSLLYRHTLYNNYICCDTHKKNTPEVDGDENSLFRDDRDTTVYSVLPFTVFFQYRSIRNSHSAFLCPLPCKYLPKKQFRVNPIPKRGLKDIMRLSAPENTWRPHSRLVRNCIAII